MRKKSMNAFRLRRQSQENGLKQTLSSILKNNYKSFTLTCSTKILPYSCRLYRVFLDRVRQNRASQRKVHQPNEKCWKFDCCTTDFSGKVKCFLCNLTRDDKRDVSNLLFVFNTFFSNLCAMIKDTR